MTDQHFLSIPIRLGLVLALLAATLSVLPVPVARAATITVNSTLDNTIAGDGNCTLREAINNANADADTTGGDCAAGTGNDIITLPANTYPLTIAGAGENNNATGDLDILAAGGDLTINGAGAGSTIIDGGGIDRVFHVCPGGGCANTVTFNGVTIRNGRVLLSGGGGIRNEGGTTTVDGSTVISNRAINGGGISNFATLNIQNGSAIGGVGAGNQATGGSGGGIYNWNGTTTVDASTVISNTATNNGGGIWNQVTLKVQNGSTIGGAGAGNQANSGGGIYNFAGTTTVDGSTVISNTVNDDGGGIYNSSDGTVTISNSTLSGNEADNGGGIFNWGGAVTVTNSTIYSNTTIGGHGGGIYNDDGAVALNDSTVHSNTSGDKGGGIRSDGDGGGATLTLNRCTVSSNTANSTDYAGGGGIYLYYSSVALTNTTISGNIATTTHGGGIGTLSDEPRTIDLVHCTIYTNTAGGDGGGMQLEPTFTVNVLNTIVAGDSAGGNGPDIYGTINSQDYNLIQDTSAATINGTTTHNITGVDPLLGPLADNGGDTQTHALLAGSPAIDAIPVISCTVATDQRGVSRPQGPACDAGAYEAESNLIYLPIILKGA